MRTTALALFLFAGTRLDAAPFRMNGWQLHEYHLPKLEEAIRKAPAYGVNFLIFSHALFDNTERVLNSPQWVRDVRHAGAVADQQKLPWYLYY